VERRETPAWEDAKNEVKSLLLGGKYSLKGTVENAEVGGARGPGKGVRGTGCSETM